MTRHSAGSPWRASIAPRKPGAFVLLAMLVAIAGCGGSVASSAPGAATPTVPVTASTAPSVARSPTASPACAALPVSGALPGDRLVAVAVIPGAASDRLSLTFAASAGAAQAGPAQPVAVLEVAQPPFVHGGSGQPLAVIGDRFVRLSLRNMTIADEAGRSFYTGPARFHPDGAAIRDVVLAEAFEGVETWVVGLAAGAACATLGRSADDMTVTIDFGRG